MHVKNNYLSRWSLGGGIQRATFLIVMFLRCQSQVPWPVFLIRCNCNLEYMHNNIFLLLFFEDFECFSAHSDFRFQVWCISHHNQHHYILQVFHAPIWGHFQCGNEENSNQSQNITNKMVLTLWLRQKNRYINKSKRCNGKRFTNRSWRSWSVRLQHLLKEICVEQ